MEEYLEHLEATPLIQNGDNDRPRQQVSYQVDNLRFNVQSGEES